METILLYVPLLALAIGGIVVYRHYRELERQDAAASQDGAEPDGPHIHTICLVCGETVQVGVHFHLSDEGDVYPCLDSEDIELHELTCKGAPAQ